MVVATLQLVTAILVIVWAMVFILLVKTTILAMNLTQNILLFRTVRVRIIIEMPYHLFAAQ